MNSTHGEEVSPGQAWLMAIRPKTLPAAISPVLVGTAIASREGVLVPLPAAAALVGALLIQIGANLANDYYDYVNGTDVPERRGPTRVAQSGLISLGHLRAGITVVFVLAALVGAYLISIAGWPILLLGLASLLSALTYTGGPFPIGYHGLGDLFVFLFFGLGGVCGAYYVQALSISRMVVVASTAIGALTVAILVINNLRDIETDRATGKRTLAVILGPAATRLQYILLLALAYAVPLLFWIAGWSSPWTLLPWLSLPIALRLAVTTLRVVEGTSLNRTLAATAGLDLIFSVLFAVGLAV